MTRQERATISGRGGAKAVRQVHASVEEMLAPEALSVISGHRVTAVDVLPFHASDGKSGSLLLSVDAGIGQRYILKRISRAWDWVMRVSGDTVCRPVVAWRTGLLDRVPESIVHGTVACAVDGEGWALLMRDLRNEMILPGDGFLSEDENATFLEAMADLHAAFWGNPDAADVRDGYCDLRRRFACFSPAVIGPEAGGPDPVPGLALAGWEAFPSLVEPEIAALIGALLNDVQPLADALSRYPQTVIHGDWKLGNLGIARSVQLPGRLVPPRRVVLLDWAITGPAPPAADLSWYLALNSARLPVSKERCISLYRQSLADWLGDGFSEDWWLPQLELCLLGTFVLFGWEKALGAAGGATEGVRARERAELAWWSERARAAARWL